MSYLFTHILAIIFSAIFIITAHGYAQDCQGCHTNPRYKKEDAERLKECLTCHGTAGHPYRKSKDSQKTGGTPIRSLPHQGIGGGGSISASPNVDLSGMILIPEVEFIMGTGTIG